MSSPPPSAGDDRAKRHLPPVQHLAAHEVLVEMADEGSYRIQRLSVLRVLVLAMFAGGLITMGALFSVLLGASVEASGPQRLLEGLGFSAGFFFVILSGAVLFTEANVTMPATLMERRLGTETASVLRFWALAWVGNLVGAFVIGWAVHLSQRYGTDAQDLLDELVASKMRYRDVGGADGWLQAVLSGVLANWLVGMAAFFATMGRTIFGKYIPVLLAVSLFVAAGFQHSPANMGFFSLAIPDGQGPGWGPALSWNIVPAGLGNILGGIFLVVVPLRFALGPLHEDRPS